MTETPEKNSTSYFSLAISAVLIIGVSIFSLTYFENSLQAKATLIAGICLVLWLLEIVPPYVPTLILWILTPLLLGNNSEEFGLSKVLKWSANPVLVLFSEVLLSALRQSATDWII